MKVLVIPTIRNQQIEDFFQSWNPCKDWDHCIVVEDHPSKTFSINGNSCSHFSWKEIDEDLGKDSWIISRKDSAIRCYGFWKAHSMGADYIFTLDDDCKPSTTPFCESHISNLEEFPRWESSILDLDVRGIPYFNKGTQNNIVLNMGLWSGVPDLDASHHLCWKMDNFDPPQKSRLIPANQYFPLCGMNFSFKKSVSPVCYFPLMGESQPYSRFDDIWFGIVAKKIFDHLGMSVSCGQPIVRHEKASNPFVNLIKESPGLQANEFFLGVNRFHFFK